MSESLVDMFGRTVRNFGNRPAVVGANKSFSYARLDAKSDEIAVSLQNLRVKPGARIGIFRKKDVDTVAGIYGILKAGCTYVPVDTKMGSTRLAAVLQDANLAALLVEPLLMPKLQGLEISDFSSGLAGTNYQDGILSFSTPAGNSSANGRKVSAEPDLAYILYTSGSTGIPKGVQHTHASALAFVSWAATEYKVSSSDRLSCHAPFHFDLTIFDLFVAAMTGACVVLIPEELVIFPFQVALLIETEKITVWYSVPFALIQLLKHGNLTNRHLALREVIFAGERFPPAQLRELAAALPDVRLSNLFGPTETNVCTYHRLSSADLDSDEFCPIGKPCPYTSIAIVDESGNQVAANEMGELLVGGSSVMTGYLNRPELNEKVFVTRISDGKSERFFRTGDLVTVPEDGAMRFHGRVDRQVKVRGFRIELDEIESALENCAGVIAAAAWIDKDSGGFAEVRAAVTTDSTLPTMSGEGLIMQIRPHLPQSAVPTQVAILDDLPRTVNGKVDYSALVKLAR
jgi:amino acid adenylation domain-containing protein